MKVVVGLGNPGARYERTRHNSGFLVIDRLAQIHGVSVDKVLCDALVGTGSFAAENLLLVKPQAFMNRSGVAVKQILDDRAASAADLVVIYDDLDLPFGRLRIRSQGGAGGHRGVASVIENLAGAPFLRIRVGIGRPLEGVEPVDYVLEPFADRELPELSRTIDRAAAALACMIQDGWQRAMELYNRA